MRHGLSSTVLERRAESGALHARETIEIGLGLGWDLALVGDRVVAATENGLTSVDHDLGGRVDRHANVRAIAARGDRLAAASFDARGAITLHDPTTLEPLTELGHAEAPVHALVVSGATLVSGDAAGRVLSHDEGARALVAKRAHAMVAVGVVEGGSIAAASLSKTIYVFDGRGGKRVWEGLGAIPYVLATHRDVVVAGVGRHLWIASSRSEPTRVAAHAGIVTALAFDAEGTLWSGGEEGWIHAWAQGPRGYGPEPKASIAGRGEVCALAFSESALFVLRRDG